MKPTLTTKRPSGPPVAAKPSAPAVAKNDAAVGGIPPVWGNIPCACGGGCPRCADAPRRELLRIARDSPATPLPRGLAQEYGARFGTDFSAVRIHTGPLAGSAATALGARAFAWGNDVVFGPGRFAPERPDGRRLLAHELAHVAQQQRPGPRAPTAQAESEAKRSAISGAAPTLAAAGPQFDPLSDEEIARLQAEGNLARLTARLQANERESLELVHDQAYMTDLQRENLALQRALTALSQVRQTVATPADPLVALEPRLTAAALQRVDDRRLERLWLVVNTWLQARLQGGQPADTPAFRQITALAHRISEEQQRRSTAEQQRVAQARAEFQHDYELSQQTPGLLGLIFPAHTRPYYRDPTQQIHNPVLRATSETNTQAFYGAAHLGRDTLAVAAGVSAAVMIVAYGGITLSATLAIAGDAVAATSTGARLICYVTTNAQSITALTEFAVNEVFQIMNAGGIASYLAALQTPQGALGLALGLMHLQISLGGSGGGSPRTATATARVESVDGDQITARVVRAPSLEGEGETPPPVRTSPPSVHAAGDGADAHSGAPVQRAPDTVHAPPHDTGHAPPPPPTRTSAPPVHAGDHGSDAHAGAPVQPAPVRRAPDAPPDATQAPPPARSGSGTPPVRPGDEATDAHSGAPVQRAPDTPPEDAAQTPRPPVNLPPVGPGRTAAQAAQQYAARWGGRLVNDAGLEGIFERTRQDSLQVERRAAAAELGRIDDILTNGINGRPVTRLRVVPPTTTQRTPDLVAEFADQTSTRVEIRTTTSAPRGRSDPHAPLATATQQRATPVTQAQLERAIEVKAQTSATRRSQLDVPLTGVSPEGTIAIVVPFARVDPAVADAAVASIGPRLGTHVQGITITFNTSSGRTTFSYHRQGTAFVR